MGPRPADILCSGSSGPLRQGVSGAVLPRPWRRASAQAPRGPHAIAAIGAGWRPQSPGRRNSIASGRGRCREVIRGSWLPDTRHVPAEEVIRCRLLTMGLRAGTRREGSWRTWRRAACLATARSVGQEHVRKSNGSPQRWDRPPARPSRRARQRNPAGQDLGGNSIPRGERCAYSVEVYRHLPVPPVQCR